MRKKLRLFSVLIVGSIGLLGLAVFASPWASALSFANINPDIIIDGGVGVAISPMSAERATLTPGETIRGEFRVRFTGAVTTQVFAEVAPFTAGEGERYATGVFDQFTPRTEIVEWASLDLRECLVEQRSEGRIYFTLPPQAECFVEYEITVPLSAYGGSQHAAIFVQTIPPQTGGVVSAFRVGHLVKHDVDGPGGKWGGEAVRVRIPRLVFSPPVRANILFENSGNFDFNASHTMTVESIFGGDPRFVEEGSSLIIAETEREIERGWDGAPRLGLFRVTVETTVLGEVQSTTRLVLIAPLWLVMTTITLIIMFAMLAVGTARFRRKRK